MTEILVWNNDYYSYRDVNSTFGKYIKQGMAMALRLTIVMSHESANQCLLVEAPISKTRLKKLTVSVLQSLCVKHALKVCPSGARGKAIKVDYIQALINFVHLSAV